MCLHTMASSRLTAVHVASAGLPALVWLHIDRYTHTRVHTQTHTLRRIHLQTQSTLGAQRVRQSTQGTLDMEGKTMCGIRTQVSTLTK